MGINNVTNTANYNAYTNTAQKKNDVSDSKQSDNATVENQETAKSEKNEASVIKSAYQPDENKIKEIFDAQKNYMRGLQNLVNQLLEQSGSNKVATFGEGILNLKMDLRTAEKYSSLVIRNNDGTYSFDPTLSNDEQAALKAKAVEDISEDGYFGVKQTSERILSFAKAITGGDPAKAEEMRNMVKKAFGEVEKMFGGKLPEISYKTYDAIMQGFDEWVGKTEAAEV